MDNNTAERAIRPFTLGRKNWGNVDSIRGAEEASALMYSLVETEKANGLRAYEYLEYVLTKLAAHQDDTSRDFLADQRLCINYQGFITISTIAIKAIFSSNSFSATKYISATARIKIDQSSILFAFLLSIHYNFLYVYNHA